jgi:hypothetical protein
MEVVQWACSRVELDGVVWLQACMHGDEDDAFLTTGTSKTSKQRIREPVRFAYGGFAFFLTG